MKTRRTRALGALDSTLATAALLLASAAMAFDPVTQDPPTIDTEHPPTMVELAFESHGDRLDGHLYIANGPGPHPTVVLLHGFPGYERNLDIAQALRRAGFNVLYFHYRGSWSSEGTFSWGGVVEDVASAIAFLRTDDARERWRVDGSRISVAGHSMGGFATLMGAAADPDLRCAVALAPANIGLTGAMARDDEDTRAAIAAYADQAGPIRASGEDLVAESIEGAEAFDVSRLGAKLVGRPVLLVAAEGDPVLPPPVFFTPLVAAYETVEGLDLTHQVLPGDHAFSWTRFAVTRLVVDWMVEECLRPAGS